MSNLALKIELGKTTFFMAWFMLFFMVQIYLFDFTKQFSNLFSKKSLCFKLTHQYFYILINIKYY